MPEWKPSKLFPGGAVLDVGLDYGVAVWPTYQLGGEHWNFTVWAGEEVWYNSNAVAVPPKTRTLTSEKAARQAGIKSLFDYLTEQAEKLTHLAKKLTPVL